MAKLKITETDRRIVEVEVRIVYRDEKEERRTLDGPPYSLEIEANTQRIVFSNDVYGEVESDMNLECGDIHGNVSVGADITCSNLSGNITAGGDVTCESVKGDIQAGGDVNCTEIKGTVVASGEVNAEDLDDEDDDFDEEFDEEFDDFGFDGEDDDL